MKTLLSYNEEESENIIQFLMPSWLEFFFYILLTFVVLLAVNYQFFIGVLKGGSSVNSLIEESIRENQLILALDSSHTFATVTLLLFWMAVGAISYSFIWFFQQSIMTVYDDIDHSHDVAPRTFRERYWESVASKYIAFFAVMLGMAAFIYVMAYMVLPKASRIMFHILSSDTTWVDGVLMLFVIVIIAVLIRFLYLLGHIFHYILSTTFTQNP
jgi:hypothetical protein